jgi:hypothetical protein
MIHQIAAIVYYLQTEKNLKKKMNTEKHEKGPKKKKEQDGSSI